MENDRSRRRIAVLSGRVGLVGAHNALVGPKNGLQVSSKKYSLVLSLIFEALCAFSNDPVIAKAECARKIGVSGSLFVRPVHSTWMEAMMRISDC